MHTSGAFWGHEVVPSTVVVVVVVVVHLLAMNYSVVAVVPVMSYLSVTSGHREEGYWDAIKLALLWARTSIM